MSPEETIVDLRQMVEDMGDEEMALEILEAYIVEVRDRLPRLDEAVSGGDFVEMERHAHSIKGGARNFSIASMAEPALALETKARQGVAEGAAPLLEAIREEFGRVCGYYAFKTGGPAGE